MMWCKRAVVVLSSWALAGLLLAALLGGLYGCTSSAGQQGSASLELKSSSFSGDALPQASSSCNGQDGASPDLAWSAPPEHTQSFALIMFDKDSPFGFKFTHWVLYGMPSDKRRLAEDVAKQEQLPDGSQGLNDYDRVGYVGPCPPGHSAHHYVFDLYALDTKLSLPPKLRGELVGQFQH